MGRRHIPGGGKGSGQAWKLVGASPFDWRVGLPKAGPRSVPQAWPFRWRGLQREERVSRACARVVAGQPRTAARGRWRGGRGASAQTSKRGGAAEPRTLGPRGPWPTQRWRQRVWWWGGKPRHGERRGVAGPEPGSPGSRRAPPVARSPSPTALLPPRPLGCDEVGLSVWLPARSKIPVTPST